MWVVKLGGSLLRGPFLADWLTAIQAVNGTELVVVTGGGVFADRIRRAQNFLGLDDCTAHDLAIVAMEQFAWICHGMAPSLVPVHTHAELMAVHSRRQIPVVLPGIWLDSDNGVSRNWSMTSDSIAAWLAGELDADGLVLVKSCSLPAKNVSPGKLARAGIVDPEFPDRAARFGGRLHCLLADDSRHLREFVQLPMAEMSAV